MDSIRRFGQRYWQHLFQWAKGNKLLVLMLLLGFFWAVGASAILFPYFSVNNDEAVYVLEALNLLEGRLTLPVTEFDQFTQPRFVFPLGDKNVFMYTHVYPAFLAVGKLLFGSMRVSLGLIASVTIGGTYALVKELYQDRVIALTAAGMLLISPLFLLHAATYLPYTFLLMMSVLFWYFSSFGLRRLHRGSLLIAGVIAGLTFWARPLNGVIIVLPVVIASWFLPWNDIQSYLKYSSRFLLGFLPVMALILFYNQYLTGNPVLFPQMAIDRYTIPDLGREFFTLTAASSAGGAPAGGNFSQDLIGWFRTTLSSLKGWTFGSWLAWLPILYVVFTRYLTRQTILVISFLWFHPLMFYLFGFMDMTPKLLEEFGPIYSIPVLVPLIILIALGTAGAFQKWRYPSLLLIAGMIVLNWFSISPKLSFHQSETEFYHEIYQPILQEEIQNGLVFIPIIFEETILHPFGYLMNSPGLDGEVIYALDRGPENIDFIKQHPGRDIYQFSLIERFDREQAGTSGADLATSFLTELDLIAVPSFQADFSISNPTTKRFVSVYLGKDDQIDSYLLDDQSDAGKRYQISWTLSDGKMELESKYLQRATLDETESRPSYFSFSVRFASTVEGEDLEFYHYRYDCRESDQGVLEIIVPPRVYYENTTGLWRMADISQVIEIEE